MSKKKEKVVLTTDNAVPLIFTTSGKERVRFPNKGGEILAIEGIEAKGTWWNPESPKTKLHIKPN